MQDQEKPDYPYVIGHRMHIRKHDPPGPFGSKYEGKWPKKPPHWKKMTQTQYCLAQKSLEGVTHEDDRRVLEVTDHVSVGYHRGAQLVVVNDSMIAKVYDPLYYEGVNRFGVTNDVVGMADGDYAREAAAYTELQGFHDARHYVPTYYGSWTAQVEYKTENNGQADVFTREVRLILIEYVKGVSMDDIHPYRLSKKSRTNIMGKVLDAEALIFYAGVCHNDLCPRNIIITSSDYTADTLLLKIIDFNISAVRRLATTMHEYEKIVRMLHSRWPGKIMSPIHRCWDGLAEFSDGWLPDTFEEQNQWLYEHFSNDARYIPVERNTEDPDGAFESIGWTELVNMDLDIDPVYSRPSLVDVPVRAKIKVTSIIEDTDDTVGETGETKGTSDEVGSWMWPAIGVCVIL